jgi:DNA processing protein
VEPRNISSAAKQSLQSPVTPNEIPPTDLRLKIEGLLGATPAAVDELIRQCQVSPAVLAAILLDLELAGRLERLPGNRVALIGTS